MKTKKENKNMLAWQQLRFSGFEMDYNLENEGSEDDEYNFYNFQGKDYHETEIETRERNT